MFFAHEHKRFIAEFADDLVKAEKVDKPEDPDSRIDGLLETFDTISAPIAHEIDNVYRESASSARSQFEAADQVSLSVLNTAARDFSRARGAELVGKKWVEGKLVENPDAQWAITDTTREVLRGTVKQAFEEGWTQVDLA